MTKRYMIGGPTTIATVRLGIELNLGEERGDDADVACPGLITLIHSLHESNVRGGRPFGHVVGEDASPPVNGSRIAG